MIFKNYEFACKHEDIPRKCTKWVWNPLFSEVTALTSCKIVSLNEFRFMQSMGFFLDSNLQTAVASWIMLSLSISMTNVVQSFKVVHISNSHQCQYPEWYHKPTFLFPPLTVKWNFLQDKFRGRNLRAADILLSWVSNQYHRDWLCLLQNHSV